MLNKYAPSQMNPMNCRSLPLIQILESDFFNNTHLDHTQNID